MTRVAKGIRRVLGNSLVLGPDRVSSATPPQLATKPATVHLLQRLAETPLPIPLTHPAAAALGEPQASSDTRSVALVRLLSHDTAGRAHDPNLLAPLLSSHLLYVSRCLSAPSTIPPLVSPPPSRSRIG
ncbi:hypothetical protein MRB53_041535 [Persea americana]|nr:hypothetical protein MRB53_041535 [Persea americana]